MKSRWLTSVLALTFAAAALALGGWLILHNQNCFRIPPECQPTPANIQNGVVCDFAYVPYDAFCNMPNWLDYGLVIVLMLLGGLSQTLFFAKARMRKIKITRRVSVYGLGIAILVFAVLTALTAASLFGLPLSVPPCGPTGDCPMVRGALSADAALWFLGAAAALAGLLGTVVFHQPTGAGVKR